MTDTEKKLLQAQHRLEKAQARDRVKERKARTRRLIQEGAILEKVLPEVRTMESTVLEDYLIQKLPQHDWIRWEVSGKPEAFLFFLPKGALTHHLQNRRWYALRHRALSEGDCDCCGSRQTMPQHLWALLSSSAQAAILCDKCRELGVDILYPCCHLPAQTCHRQLCRRDGRCERTAHFLLYERETEKRNEVNERWQFTIWKQKWSARAQDAPPWPPPLI